MVQYKTGKVADLTQSKFPLGNEEISRKLTGLSGRKCPDVLFCGLLFSFRPSCHPCCVLFEQRVICKCYLPSTRQASELFVSSFCMGSLEGA